jgi:pyruvate-ferredoxin/flavodoxin oxidoreductase
VRSTYLISQANFVGCHQPGFLERYGVLDPLLPHGTFLFNTPFGPDDIWSHLPESAQQELVVKRARFFVIDAHKVARESGMGGRINTIMQTCFFAVSGVLPRDEAVEAIKESIRKAYGKKGAEIVRMNLDAVDQTLAHLFEVEIPDFISQHPYIEKTPFEQPPAFVRDVLSKMIAGRGDELPVSALPVDGAFPSGTSRWEKRNLAQEVPVWDSEICIQCGKCVLVCPHAVIRSKVYEPVFLATAPPSFKSRDARLPEWNGLSYTLQVSVEGCTGCSICVDVCPVRNKSEARLKAINMRPQLELRETERQNWDFFWALPDRERRHMHFGNVREMQVAQPLFEFSGACAGCGETPYIKLLTQLFGDRLLIANATGCSSIYGGNLPTTPYSAGIDGRGPAWSNSLFEDAAEFGLGFRVSLDKQQEFAKELLNRLDGHVSQDLAQQILTADQQDAAGIYSQRGRVNQLKRELEVFGTDDARRLLQVADTLVRKG